MKASTAKKIWRHHAYGRDSRESSTSTFTPSVNDSSPHSLDDQCIPNASTASSELKSIEQVSTQSIEHADNHDTNSNEQDHKHDDKENEEVNGTDKDIEKEIEKYHEETIMDVSDVSDVLDVSDDEDIFQLEGKSFHISQYIEEHNRKTCSTIHQEGTPFLSLHYPSIISSMCLQ